ncbi:MAG TPA: type II secretion system F family protein [Gaiellales bacterium]|nr:type II secretion system F family protein [Gaiellales bacterium]
MLVAAAAAAYQALCSWRRDRDLNGSGRIEGHRLDLFAAVGKRARALGIRPPAPPGIEGHGPRTPSGSERTADTAELRAGSLTVFGAAGLLAVLATGSMVGLAVGLGSGVFGWVFPDLWLRAARRARADEIEQQAPLALDLIASAVAAGIPIDDAMRLAAEVSTGALHEELEVALANLRLGQRRHVELTELAERTASPSLRRLGAALRMSDRLGVPLAEVLRTQAARARVEQTRRIQERAARASPRILLVVVFLLVPAAMLPVMTALALVAAHSVGPVIDGSM